MANLMTFALFLLRKLRGADPATRDRLTDILREIRDTGLIPLGMRSDESGPAYVWLLFDRSLLTPGERDRHIRVKTPPGVRTRTIEI